jgi:membrane-associated phospholipid phosphatase
MRRITVLGGHKFLVPANLAIIAYAYFIRRRKWFALKTFAVAFSSLLLMFGLKALFNRSRPISPLLGEVAGLSFPSGHAFMSFTFFGLLIYVVYQRVDHKLVKWMLICLLLTITFLVGMSRIYLRVHYPSDVMAGFAIGTMWLILSLYIMHLIEKNKAKLPAI